MLNGFQLSTAGQLGLSDVWNEVGKGVAARVILRPTEQVLYMGNRFYLTNCRWMNGGKWVEFKNRIKPVSLPPAPPPPPATVAPPPVVRRPVQESPPPPPRRVPVVEHKEFACPAFLSFYSPDTIGQDTPSVVVWVGSPDLRVQKWTFNGVEMNKTFMVTLTFGEMLKAAGGKPGLYPLAILASDSEGRELRCGINIRLMKKGRMWVFKLPGVHCVYAYTKDIKNWSAMGTVEKVGFCPAEAALALWLWPVGDALHKIAFGIGTRPI
jgi:hypothetical protein